MPQLYVILPVGGDECRGPTRGLPGGRRSSRQSAAWSVGRHASRPLGFPARAAGLSIPAGAAAGVRIPSGVRCLAAGIRQRTSAGRSAARRHGGSGGRVHAGADPRADCEPVCGKRV